MLAIVFHVVPDSRSWNCDTFGRHGSDSGTWGRRPKRQQWNNCLTQEIPEAVFLVLTNQELHISTALKKEMVLISCEAFNKPAVSIYNDTHVNPGWETDSTVVSNMLHC